MNANTRSSSVSNCQRLRYDRGTGGGGGRADRSTWKTAGFGGTGTVIVSYASPISVDSTNRARYFTGTSTSTVTVADNNLLDFGLDFTTEAWIHPTVTDCSGNHVFMGKENSFLFAICNNFISYALMGTNGSWQWNQTTMPVSVNTWAHFAFVRSGARLTIFKNGGAAAGGTELTTTTNVPSTIMSNSAFAFQVGARQSCAVECYTGYVDDVRLWSYARSASAVAQNFNKHVAADVLYFPFDESGGTLTANHSATTGSALNGTATATATVATGLTTPYSSSFSASNVSGFLPGYDYTNTSAPVFSISSNGAKGTATVSASTGAFSYVANAGAAGADTFTYAVTNANGSSTYTFTVNAPTQPMASSKTFTQSADVAATLNTATSLGYNNPSTAYTLGETVRATLSVTNGTVSLTLNGTALISGALGSSTFTIDGTQSQINAALNSATVTATSAIPTRVTLDIGMKPADQTISSRVYKYNSNGHFYTRITPSSNTYAVAQSNAAGMSLGGRPGYLATIQGSSENSTISGINGTNSWIGATDRPTQGTYRW
jgi:hypothetical protein